VARREVLRKLAGGEYFSAEDGELTYARARRNGGLDHISADALTRDVRNIFLELGEALIGIDFVVFTGDQLGVDGRTKHT